MYKRMEDPNKSYSIRYKARLVAKWFAQNEMVDYKEIFSLVVKHTSIRVLLSIKSCYSWWSRARTTWCEDNLQTRWFGWGNLYVSTWRIQG